MILDRLILAAMLLVAWDVGPVPMPKPMKAATTGHLQEGGAGALEL